MKAQSLSQHYDQQLNLEQIEQLLCQQFPDRASSQQLAAIDQLHIGGLGSSIALVDEILKYQPSRVLDIGSGLGGLQRLLLTAGCNTIGIDLTHRFNQLSSLLGKHHQQIQQPVLNTTGDASSLPFASDSFDALVLQHALVNIPNKAQLLSECSRVVTRGGKLWIHEILLKGEVAAFNYPVPWSSCAEHNQLASLATLKTTLDQAGLQIDQCEDISSQALRWRQQKNSKTPSSALTPEVIFGARFRVMAANLTLALEEGLIAVVKLEVTRPRTR